MAMYVAVERNDKWEVLYSHVNGDDLIKVCDTEKQARKLIEVLEDEVKDPKIEDIVLDAQDAFYEFDDENDNIFTDDDRLVFIEGFNRGQEAMRAKVLTLLGEMSK